MNNLDKILEKTKFCNDMLIGNWYREDIVEIVKEALIEFALEYDFNPCTSKKEIERCANEFCKPQNENVNSLT